ncbi:MAG: adenosine deaminase [Pseudomonadota bacterium]
MKRLLIAGFVLVAAACTTTRTDTGAAVGDAATTAESSLSATTNADALFARAAGSRAMLRLLLQTFPKGGDLHRHAGGTTYAEDFLAFAEDDGGCYVLATRMLAAGPCEAGSSVPLQGLALRDTNLYNQAINAISMGRHGPQYKDPSISGHEQFFNSSPRRTFSESRNRDEVIADNLVIAAAENTLYLELMSNPDMAGADLSALVPKETWNEADMAGRLQRLQPYLAQAVPLARNNTDASDRRIAELNGCGAVQPPAACVVTLRYLITVSRRAVIEDQFSSMALAFALVQADPRYVGVNIAAPEDLPAALRDYSLHMRMFAFFKQRYPEVPLSLHAGELSLGLVPPRDLRFHIREAVEIAGASRIGHGIDIAYEDGAPELLARMARDGVAVEINLTSNDVILGVKGKDHPLPLYMAAGVPVTLSSDDLGVSRADLTEEYVRAVDEYGLTYSQLKQISRNTLSYSFLAPDAKARELQRLDQAFEQYESRLPAIFVAVPLGL